MNSDEQSLYDPDDDTPSLEWQIGHMTGVVKAYEKEVERLRSKERAEANYPFALIERAERAEAELAAAANEINCAGPIAHRIRVMKKEYQDLIEEKNKEIKQLQHLLHHYGLEPIWMENEL